MSESESVSKELFDYFKGEIVKAIDDLKNSLGKDMAVLSFEVKAFNKMAQDQSNVLTRHDTEISQLKEENKLLRDKVESQSTDITTLKTVGSTIAAERAKIVLYTTGLITVLGFILKLCKVL